MVERVTIRVAKGKEDVYPEFKRLVTEELHSDVCYVTTELWEVFLAAMKNAPEPHKPVIMEFLKQNIQINMGCTFQYYTQRAKRQPHDAKPIIETSVNHLLPNLLDQWANLKPEAKRYWLAEFKRIGIIPTCPTSSTGKRERAHKKIFKILKLCMTKVTGWFRKER
jgi:hypothetical protein